MQSKVFDMKANEVGVIELNDQVFGQEYNEALIHQVVVAQMANKRQGTKSTLTRTEVRGGGIKPWRQKGTGRARQGSTRAPQWIKGGVVFAPKPRDFSKKVNQRAKTEALKSALSYKAANKEMIVLDKVELAEAKTKYMAELLKNFNLGKKTLLVVGSHNDDVVLASRNLQELTVCVSDLLNVYDVVANATLLVTADAVKNIEEAYAEY